MATMLLPPPVPRDRVSAREVAPLADSIRAAARAVAEALFATEDGPPDRERLDWAVNDLADYMTRSPGRARLLLALGFFVLTWVAPLLVRRLGPLASLDLALRARALGRVEGSLLAPAALGPKAMLCMIWFEHDRTRKETRTEVTCSHA